MDIIIPTCLADIPLYQMQEYEALEMEAEERTLNAVAIFCSLSLKEVSKLPIKILNRAIENIKGALEEKPKFQPRFKYKGVEYGFIPNLDELSTGEFIDLDTYQKDKTAIWKMMSVLYRPIVQSGQNERYLIEPYSGKLNEAFKEMPCDVAFGCLLFFWNLGADLMSYILNYSVEEKQRQMNTNSTKNGAGWDSFTYSLMEMSQSLTELANYPFTPLPCGGLTRQTWQRWKEQLLKNNEQ